MTRNVLNQLECKIGKAGEILCNTDDTGNVLLFVSSGKLVIYNQNQTPVADVDEGHFVLLPAEKSFIAIAITSTRLILMHAGPLSEMITDDPEWNPDRPVILPICPSLAKTLYIIEYYQNEKRTELTKHSFYQLVIFLMQTETYLVIVAILPIHYRNIVY